MKRRNCCFFHTVFNEKITMRKKRKRLRRTRFVLRGFLLPTDLQNSIEKSVFTGELTINQPLHFFFNLRNENDLNEN